MSRTLSYTLKVQLLDPLARVPTRGTKLSAGLDLYAFLAKPEELKPGARVFIPTGIGIELPSGHEGQIRSRSGLACKHGITVINAPATIDEDYRGEIQIALLNTSFRRYTVNPGDRIAQLIIAPVTRVGIEIVEELEESQRGGRGFGSTGR